MSRICHITTVHRNRYDIRIFEKECISLKKEGYDVFLLVNDDKTDEIKNGVNIISLRERPYNRIDRIFRVSRLALKKAIEIDADCFHIHDPELLVIVPYLKKREKKVIFDSHEFTAIQIRSKKYIPMPLRKPISTLYLQYEKMILGKCDCIIAPCTFEGKDYFSKICTKKALVCNYPSVEALEKMINQKSVGSNYGISESVLRQALCYVGAISESRGIYNMIKAAYHAGKKLIVIGTIADDIYENLTSMPEYECVEYLGPLQHGEAMKILSKCAIGLSLLLDKGQYMKIDTLPTKNYEYMYLGIPSVLSRSPYSEELLLRYKCGISVDPDNIDEIVNAINTIMTNKELYKMMSEAGKIAVKEEFNWENESNKLIDIYKSIGV